MIEFLLQPFAYDYMLRAIFTCTLVGATCAFLSAYLMLKGWSLIGDALSHAIVPGVALAYIIGAPFALGAFFSGMLAAAGMNAIQSRTKLREDVIIGIVFSSFFAAGLLIISIYPTSVNIQAIILGNVLTIPDYDLLQVVLICSVTLLVLLLKWRDFMVLFFDMHHAATIGLRTTALRILFFTLLSATTVAALQTVGACLVIAMLVTPGVTAYLYTDQFPKLILISVLLGTLCSAAGAYLSFFLNAPTGALIVCLQSIIFLLSFSFAPKYGLFMRGSTA